MKKLLHVVASPRGEKSRSLKVANAFLERFREVHPEWLIDEINVFDKTLPHLTARQVDGKYVLLGGKELYGDLRELWEGYHELSRAFFNFCGQVVEKEGYFRHKYTPSGRPASSWLPWIRDGRRQLPIQEDETALVIWSLWEHYCRYRDIDFITPLYRPLIKNGANFLMNYRDLATGLPLASYDLWEERQSVQTFTVAAVYGGLLAAANFVAAFGEIELAADYRAGAEALREAAGRWLFLPEERYFARAISFPANGDTPHLDRTVDASICGVFLFGLFPADDPRVVSSLRKVHEVLWCKTVTGGLARYENDPYYRYGLEGPGNPWFVTTLWYARYLIDVAGSVAELAPAMDLLVWAAAHALPSGVLAEQLEPQSGAPLSVSPLTWSHATYVTTVCAYREKRRVLQKREMKRKKVVRDSF